MFIMAWNSKEQAAKIAAKYRDYDTSLNVPNLDTDVEEMEPRPLKISQAGKGKKGTEEVDMRNWNSTQIVNYFNKAGIPIAMMSPRTPEKK